MTHSSPTEPGQHENAVKTRWADSPWFVALVIGALFAGIAALTGILMHVSGPTNAEVSAALSSRYGASVEYHGGTSRAYNAWVSIDGVKHDCVVDIVSAEPPDATMVCTDWADASR